MTTQYQQDIRIGEVAETNIFKLLKEKYPTITRTDRYHPVDFIDHKNKTLYELKCRRVCKDQYQETLVPVSKIEYARMHPEYKLILLFQFTDGLYYVEWHDQIRYREDIFSRHHRTGKIDNKTIYAFIEVNQLQPFE